MSIKPKHVLLLLVMGLLLSLSFVCLAASEKDSLRLSGKALSSIEAALTIAEDLSRIEDIDRVKDLVEQLQDELEGALDNLEKAIRLDEEIAELRPVIKTYFAYPATERAEDDQPEQVLIEIINELDTGDQLDVAMYSFTDNDLRSAVKRAAERGVNIRLFLEASYINREQKDAPSLEEILGSGPVTIRLEQPSSYLMHHKYALIDRQMVITGSYNWSDAANMSNWENLLVIQDQETVDKYGRDFDNLWNNYYASFPSSSVEPGVPIPCNDFQPGDVIIYELLVNAPGSTEKAEIPNEYFTLLNTTTRTVDLRGLMICDEQACWTIRSTMTDAIIGPYESWTIYGRTYNPIGDTQKIALRNSGETVRLKCGSLELDSWSYPKQSSDGVPIRRTQF